MGPATIKSKTTIRLGCRRRKPEIRNAGTNRPAKKTSRGRQSQKAARRRAASSARRIARLATYRLSGSEIAPPKSALLLPPRGAAARNGGSGGWRADARRAGGRASRVSRSLGFGARRGSGDRRWSAPKAAEQLHAPPPPRRTKQCLAPPPASQWGGAAAAPGRALGGRVGGIRTGRLFRTMLRVRVAGGAGLGSRANDAPATAAARGRDGPRAAFARPNLSYLTTAHPSTILIEVWALTHLLFYFL